jgi:uncharacterized membrane protein
MAQRVHETIEVQAPLQDVFRYWSNFENFPSFMQNVEEVRMSGQDTSHWTVKGPLGKSVEFDARTTEMDPDRGIGWNTTGGEVMTSGEARFEDLQPRAEPEGGRRELLQDRRAGRPRRPRSPDASRALQPTDYRLTS